MGKILVGNKNIWKNTENKCDNFMNIPFFMAINLI